LYIYFSDDFFLSEVFFFAASFSAASFSAAFFACVSIEVFFVSSFFASFEDVASGTSVCSVFASSLLSVSSLSGKGVVIALASADFISDTFLIIPFMIIRRFSGGYHTKNIWTCLILSCGLMAGFTYLSQYIDNKWIISFITAAASIELMVLGPVDSVNYRLTYDEKQYF